MQTVMVVSVSAMNIIMLPNAMVSYLFGAHHKLK